VDDIEARVRASELLMTFLSAKQRRTLIEHSWVEERVRVKRWLPKRRVRWHMGYTKAWWSWEDRDRILVTDHVRTYCVKVSQLPNNTTAPTTSWAWPDSTSERWQLPLEDRLLTHLLHVRADSVRYFKSAMTSSRSRAYQRFESA
jgi:hypothetical protein